jgi:hypothetical protein
MNWPIVLFFQQLIIQIQDNFDQHGNNFVLYFYQI